MRRERARRLDRLITEAVGYTSERKQFGKPVGSFQAVKHMLANAKVKLEYARPLVYRAAYSVAHAAAERSVHVSMAKLAAGEAGAIAARTALQVHGAIGFTREYALHHLTRRLWAWREEFGGEAYWQRRLGTQIAADGADGLWPRLAAD